MLTREQFQQLYDEGPDAVWATFETLQLMIEKHQLLFNEQQKQIEQLSVQNKQLTVQVKQLQDRLNKDSSNSNSPPSTDGFKKKTVVSLRTSSGRKPGGQKGHKGYTLPLSDKPDHLITHAPTQCTCCGENLEQTKESEDPHNTRRQVFELPPMNLVITEHRISSKVCPHCQSINQGEFPPQVTQPTQYGHKVKAFATYCLNFLFLSYERLEIAFSDLFHHSISTSTLFSYQKSAAKVLKPVVEQIKQALCKSPLVHFDETGFRVNGSLHWLHLGSTSTLTHYTCHERRGKIGMEASGILPKFTGIAVHDCWKAYFSYKCSHSLCNSHHLRELKGIYQDTKQNWANEFSLLLLEGKKAVAEAKSDDKSSLNPVVLLDLFSRYDALLSQGFAENPYNAEKTGKRGSPKQSKSYNLLERLKVYRTETTRFLVDFSVPFDNNLAERDVRMMKVQQKVSGCFRTKAGADNFCTIRSYLSTHQKQKTNLLQALEHVFLGTPLLPKFT